MVIPVYKPDGIVGYSRGPSRAKHAKSIEISKMILKYLLVVEVVLRTMIEQ